MLAISETGDTGLVVPTIDDELELFGRERAAFEARGIRVAVSPQSTSAICNDKLATCRYLRDRDLPAAETRLPSELPAVLVFPLFVKPRFGRGGVGAFPDPQPARPRFLHRVRR